MAVIAVAGGTGGIGRAVVEAIVARGAHQVKILGRKANDSLAAELGVPILTVDYSDVASLTKLFEAENIDTVISTLSTMPQERVPPEVSLVRAAQASTKTRRFMPSNWGAPLDGEAAQKLPSTVMKAQTLAELSKSDLEYTSFFVGFLTDFFATPAIKTYMNPMIAVVDMAHNVAAIPGSGNTPVTFTHTLDLAKYVDRVQDLPKWGREYTVIGDKVTWIQFVEIVEKAKGTKFKIIYDKIEDLKEGKATELPALTKALPYIPISREHLLGFVATFGLMFDDGTFNLDEKLALNNKFPDIETLKIKDALEAAVKAWNAKQDVPDDLLSIFEVIHVRFFSFVLLNEEVPDGDPDIESVRIDKTKPGIKIESLAEMFKLLSIQDPRFEPLWVTDLPNLLSAAGFIDIEVDKNDYPPH
ncbi:nmra-like family [Paramyrothecium foliicola]|nr:nmra-like family [Paramyrothecium foliicola]